MVPKRCRSKRMLFDVCKGLCREMNKAIAGVCSVRNCRFTQSAAMGIQATLSQTLFSVAEFSKQGICVPRKYREAEVPCSSASFLGGLPAP